jgi:hypothetical protein
MNYSFYLCGIELKTIMIMASITFKYEEFKANSGDTMYMELRWDKYTNAKLWYYGSIYKGYKREMNRYHIGRKTKPNKKRLIEMY